MNEERIWVLLARRLANEATGEEIKELEDLLRADPELHFKVETLSRLWRNGKIEGVSEDKVGSLLKRVRNEKGVMPINDIKKRTRQPLFKRDFMFRNYIKTAWRNIIRHKGYAAINIMGLSLGICACIVIYLITAYELSFDKFHPDKDRIFRIVGEMEQGSGEKMFLNSLVPEVAGFQKEIPGFEAAAGFHLYDGKVEIPGKGKDVKKFDNRIKGSYSTSSIITWPEYFDIFKYDWLAGNPSVLKDPYTVVLSENRGHEYFGNISPAEMIGKMVIYDDSLQVHVAGIVKDWNKNTDFGFTDFISIGTATSSFLKNQIPTDDWSSLGPHRSMAFVKLQKGVTAEQINTQFAAFVSSHLKPANDGSRLTMQLQPLTDIHFTKDFHRGDDGDDFRKPYLPTLYALIGLALFILVIAAVNFINLSTAQSIQRTKEIGIRKVLGDNKAGLVSQFLTETFILTLLAVLVSVLLVGPVLALFSSYIPQGVIFHPVNASTLIFLLVISVVTTLLAGLYPAKVIAARLPVWSLKGVGEYKGSGWSLRKGLIVFQFTISLIFIIGSIVIGNQIRFMRYADKGFNSDGILTINHWRDKDGKTRILAENIRHIAGVEQVILQGNSPMGFAHGQQGFMYKSAGKMISFTASFDAGDENYIPFYQMKLVAGRNMMHSDSMKEVVINETCSKALGFANPQDAINGFLYQGNKSYPIVGVVADFHEGSFHDPMRPVVIGKEREWSIAIKLTATGKQADNVKAILPELAEQWKKVYPDEGFNYSFLSDAITWLYDQETKTAWLMNIAMIVAIFISCMGLFGLGMFAAQRRTREIGIRKVLGASVAGITSMLTKDFIRLILVALLIASPVAWYFMNRWLQDFAYRVNISWWVFVIAGLAAVFIASVTTSFQAIKAAIANPVKSLRTE